MRQRLKIDRYQLILAIILLLAFVIRLRGFDLRFLFSSDTARDLLVARGAIKLNQLPWVGSFSSAGPFVFGPNWYWFLMLPIILLPNVFLSPWLFMLVISLGFVWLLALAGKILGGKRLGLIAALIAAVSPAVIGISSYLTQHGLVEICAAVALVGFLAYLKSGKMRFVFLTGLGAGAAVSLHYQGVYLLVYFPIMFFVKIRDIKSAFKFAVASGLGLVLLLWPMLLWDSSRNFRNLEQLIYYFRVGQYRFWVSDRWLLYVGSFWPTFLGKIAGGPFVAGMLFGLSSLVVISVSVIRRKVSLTFLYFLAAIGIQIIWLRYLRSERLDGYLIYFHAGLILLVGWVLNQILRINKILGLLASFSLIVSGLYFSKDTMNYNNNFQRLAIVRDQLEKKFPGEKLAVYGKGLATSNVSYSFSLALEASGDESDFGRPVGICLYSSENCGLANATESAKGEFQGQEFSVVDLSENWNLLTKQNGWYPFSVLAVYDDVQNWWRKGI
ncbi:hypothetical protein M1403_01355 [Patescibacteria group bacterium]|nr:hypothetical protein [Patescibacteria group bacterium]